MHIYDMIEAFGRYIRGVFLDHVSRLMFVTCEGPRL